MLFLKNFLVGNIGLAQKISMGNKTQLFIITIIILPLHNQFFIHYKHTTSAFSVAAHARLRVWRGCAEESDDDRAEGWRLEFGK
jgi:hypothetical protein